MKSYANYIESVLAQEPENQLLEAGVLYKRSFSMISELSYYKTLERMCKKGTLVHLTKGLYYRPKASRFGTIPISEKEIMEHYTSNGQGMVIGYKLYHQKGLTTQVGKSVSILSTALKEQRKTIGNVSVINTGLDLTEETIPVIETLEILQNYRKIEDINNQALAAYMRKFASLYSDSAAVYVLDHKKYKKSTIAFLERFLNFHGIKNTLCEYLSPLSSYDIPGMEEFYESA